MSRSLGFADFLSCGIYQLEEPRGLFRLSLILSSVRFRGRLCSGSCVHGPVPGGPGNHPRSSLDPLLHGNRPRSSSSVAICFRTGNSLRIQNQGFRGSKPSSGPWGEPPFPGSVWCGGRWPLPECDRSRRLARSAAEPETLYRLECVSYFKGLMGKSDVKYLINCVSIVSMFKYFE